MKSEWALMTWREVRDRSRQGAGVVLIPVGSVDHISRVVVAFRGIDTKA